MKKIIFITTLLYIVIFSSKSNAVSFYSGIGLGKSKAKIDDTNIDDKHSFTFSLGSSFDIPLFPIRIEGEYLNFNSKNDLYDIKTYGSGINTYINLPLLPILVPYIGLGLSYLKEKNNHNEQNITKKSDSKIVPQYMIGLDLDLPTVIFAGSMEYRYINTDFEFADSSNNSKYHIFLLKLRLKF